MRVAVVSYVESKPDCAISYVKNNNLKTIAKEKTNNENHLYGFVYPKAYYPNICFLGNITPEQRKKCHLAIHGASAACASLSGAMGEGAAVGADTPFLWGTQALMFFYLRDLLNVDPLAHIQYMLRQYVVAQNIGVNGAKSIIGWLGIGGHMATGGSASVPITGAVRSVNALLSAALTEGMGWGYVSSYKADAMTAKRQLLANAFYYTGSQVVGKLQDHFGLLDPANVSDIKTAIESIPQDQVSIVGKVMKEVTKYINVPRTGVMFVSSFIQGAVATRKMDERSQKEVFKQLVGTILLNSIIYELLNIPNNNDITNESIQVVQELGDKIKNTPEVFQEFTKVQQQLIDKLNIDKMDSREFIRQFQDKQFTYNIAIKSAELSNIVADNWRKKDLVKLKQKNQLVASKLNDIQNRTNIINNSLSEKNIKDLEREMQNIINKTKEELNNKNRNHHALNRIAGYEGIKSLLNLVYIENVKNKKEIPNTILFYGPSGLGKTAIGPALAEEVGARFKKEDIGFRTENKLIEKIKNYLSDAEQLYNETGRYTVIQLNEIDGFLTSDSKLRKEFSKIIKDCGSKYHTTIFMTSNNPLNIHKDILNNLEISIPVEPPSINDIKDIVEYYVNNREIENFNSEKIAQEFESVKPEYSYSNAQIENIILRKLPKECSQQDFISIIKSTTPNISRSVIEKFEQEKNVLENRG